MDLSILQDMAKHCEACQRFEAAPIRFKVSISDTDIVFGDELSIDLMTVRLSCIWLTPLPVSPLQCFLTFNV